MCDRLSITSLICFLSIRNLNLPLKERMDRIYHGCWLMYSNGTNEIIHRSEKCLTPTSIFPPFCTIAFIFYLPKCSGTGKIGHVMSKCQFLLFFLNKLKLLDFLINRDCTILARLLFVVPVTSCDSINTKKFNYNKGPFYGQQFIIKIDCCFGQALFTT